MSPAARRLFLKLKDRFYAHDKQRQRASWEAELAASAAGEQQSREEYQAQRSTALQTYLASPECRRQFVDYESTFLELYRRLEPNRFRDAAREAAADKIEREQFQFLEFGVWLL